MNLESSVINISAHILRILREHRVMRYEELLHAVVVSTSEDAKKTFLSALGFLFVLGKITYKKSIDSFEMPL